MLKKSIVAQIWLKKWREKISFKDFTAFIAKALCDGKLKEKYKIFLKQAKVCMKWISHRRISLMFNVKVVFDIWANLLWNISKLKFKTEGKNVQIMKMSAFDDFNFTHEKFNGMLCQLSLLCKNAFARDFPRIILFYKNILRHFLKVY